MIKGGPAIVAAVIAFLALVPAVSCAAEAGDSKGKAVGPNILWLSVEDMSPWLACYGDKTAPTPNIDRLAREGVRYSNVFATTPVCAPARHTIITGMYATSTGAMHMRNGSHSQQALADNPHAYDGIPLYEAVPPPELRCFPEFLRQAGYYCTNNHKTDYQFKPPVTAWDDSSNQAHWRNRGEGQPFFAVFNCEYTHESRAFPNARVRSHAVKPEDVPVPPYYPDTPAVRQTLAQTYNNIVSMDEWVGEHVAEIEKAGLLDSTIIVFFSDHGVGLPRGKRYVYDSGLRVPLVIRFPDGHGAGTTDDRLVSFIDFAPTMLSLGGVEPKGYMRGRPFLGTFAAPPAPYAFATRDRMDEKLDTMRSVMDGRFKYIRNFHPEIPYMAPQAYRDRLTMMKDIYGLKRSGKATPEQWQMVADSKPAEEFYDTRQDPFEIHNLIDDPAHAQRIQAMRQALDRWMDETHDLGLIQPEAKLVREKLWPPDGVQPVTAEPRVEITRSAGRGPAMSIHCDTAGASIGWREPGQRSWSVYDKPVPVPSAATIEVIAHRIGFKPSAVVSVDVNAQDAASSKP